jgi:rhamnose transport system permease protein
LTVPATPKMQYVQAPVPNLSRVSQILHHLARWEALLFGLLIAFFVLGNALSPYFLSATNFSNLTSQTMEVAIMALPLTLIIIAGEIDLSIESTLGLSSALLGLTWAAGWPLSAGIPLCLAVGAVAGLLNGILVARVGLPSLVVTLGTLALYRGFASVLLESRAVSNFPAAFANFGFGTIPSTLIPWSAVLFGILAVAASVLLHRTWIGRQIFAVGKNAEAARFSGVRVARIKIALFVLSGVIAAAAGIVLTARLSSARADNGQGLVLDVVTVVLLGGVNIFGGRGTIAGVVLSIFVIGELRSGLLLANISSEIQSIGVGLLLVLSVILPTLVRQIPRATSRIRTALTRQADQTIKED